MFFKRRDKDDKTRVYELFLDNIDDLSQIRLRGYDISFNNLKNKLNEIGLILTEVSCTGENIVIKRTKKGYFLVSSTKTDLNKENSKVFNKYRNDFERIHEYLLDKENIMKGNYTCHKKNIEELKNISALLGYGDARDKILNKNAQILLNSREKHEKST